MRRHLGLPAFTISYDMAEGDTVTLIDSRTAQQQERMAEDSVSCTRIQFYPWNWSYDAIVAFIVNYEVPSDRMDAIQNNYLLDPTDPEAKAEFDWMQSKRAKAKVIAKEAIRLAEEVYQKSRQ